MERVRGIGESRGPVTAGLGFVEMRVEHDVCAVPGGPADRFRIAPTFMADGDAECQRAGLENPPAGTGRIDALLGGIELDFVLETGDRSVSIDDQRGELTGRHRRRVRCREQPRYLPSRRPLQWRTRRVRGTPGREAARLPHASVAGNEAFRKADEAGALDRRLSDGLFGQCDRLLGSRREPECWRVRFETCSLGITGLA